MSQKDWTLEEWIVNAFGRFVGEMPPWFNRKLIAEFASPLPLSDPAVVSALESMEKRNIIHFTKTEDAYILFTEEYILKRLINDNSVTKICLELIKEKKLELGIE